jgi:hypothetical protein
MNGENNTEIGGLMGMGDGEDDELMGLGDVLGDADVLGAVRRARARMGLGKRMLLPGVPAPGGRRQWLPFPVAAMGVSAAGVAVAVNVNAQRPFRGYRIVAAARGNEAGFAASLTGFLISNVPQPISSGSTPLEAFAAGAFDLAVDLDSSLPGVLYELVWSVDARGGAPTATNIVTSLFGKSLAP